MNVNAAGLEGEVVSDMLDCPPHLIGLLIGRGGSTIKRIKEESQANVVINQKLLRVSALIYTILLHGEFAVTASLVALALAATNVSCGKHDPWTTQAHQGGVAG